MSARTCSDGSSCVITADSTRLATVSRYVEGVLVWGQVFTGSAETHDAIVGRVVAEMVAHPENFDRRLLWDADGKAVKP